MASSRILPALILLICGIILASLTIPNEITEVHDQLIGFPDSHALAHQLRPYVLGLICFLPAIAALYYACCRAIDRYLIRQFTSAFLLCFGTLFAIWLVSDIQNNLSDFKESENGASIMAQYYLAAFPRVFVESAPFGLLLAMLLSLGKLSRAQEIVSIIQTGRGIARLILPFVMMGLFIGLLCLGFNYRWAPWAVSYQDSLLDQAKEGSISKARNVVYFQQNDQRLWLIGSFPDNYQKGEPLQGVIVRSFTPDGRPDWKLQAQTAAWSRESNQWTFRDWTLQRFNLPLTDSFAPQTDQPLTFTGWEETPWKLIKPGLSADNLGIPGLYSWLITNRESQWGDKRRFLTQWYYRWAQPWICLAIVMIAAPLGIVFSHRGAAGGIAMAVFMCAGLMFSSTIFLALGQSGYLPPVWAAWGTNIITVVIALFLIQRRLVGRPIYQTLRSLIPV